MTPPMFMFSGRNACIGSMTKSRALFAFIIPVTSSSFNVIAKYKSDAPNDVIKNWMRNRETLEFLGLWERLHNPDFNRVQFEAVKNEAGLNRFVMTPSKWIEQMNSIGIVSKSGRYGGGTYAHSDIALEFASWISSSFLSYQDLEEMQLMYSIRFS